MPQQRPRRAQIHEQHRQTARDAQRTERAHDRVQQDRDQRGDHENEHRVVHGRQQQPRAHHDQRQAHELHPPRDQDLPGGRGRTSAIRQSLSRVGVGGRRDAADRTAIALPWTRDFEPHTVRRYPRRRPDHRRARRRVGLVLVVACWQRWCCTGYARARQQATPGAARPAGRRSRRPDGPPHAGEPGHRPGRPGAGRADHPAAHHRDRLPRRRHRAGRHCRRPGRQRNADLLTAIAKMLTGVTAAPAARRTTSTLAVQGPATGSVDVGAVAGTSVYSPVDGKVTVQPYVISGKAYGSVIQIQPTDRPDRLVTLTNVSASAGIVVGQAGDGRGDQARDDRSTCPRCCPRRWPSTPRTPATTCTSRSARLRRGADSLDEDPRLMRHPLHRRRVRAAGAADDRAPRRPPARRARDRLRGGKRREPGRRRGHHQPARPPAARLPAST